MLPYRVPVPVFGATLYDTVAAPVPDLAPFNVIQESSVDAVQVHPLGALGAAESAPVDPAPSTV